ncbi:MAG TPA: serine/threonine-protein kinase, partial [Planctomycetaceae bacterium]|nr:serine/threonine-protein kinase [Planctomycetaceae bacterium]
RDIKPSNLLIRKDGVVKLTDMGLARSVDESLETNITRAGTTVGTVDYMAPEQARNSKSADIRSDLYSLGATWFHLLAGHPPFSEGSMLNKLNAHAAKARPDVRDDNDSVPETISVMIQRLMALKPEDRYQTPAELLEDLNNENLTRGPMSLQDLAALAKPDSDDDDERNTRDQRVQRSAPKSAYKKPVAQEAKQLLAPTLEIPVMPAAPVSEAKTGSGSGFDARSLKTLGIIAAVVAVIAGLGWLTSNFGGAVVTPTNPGQNAFDREVDSNNAPTVVTSDAGNSSSGTTVKPPAPETKKSLKPLTPTNTGSQTAIAKDGDVKTTPSPAGSLYLPPLAPLGREGEVRFVSEWITANGSPASNSLKTTLVGGGPSGFENVPTLNEALRQLPAAGGVVELVTDGPYFLNPLELLNRATVVIRAANGTRPVVVMVAEPDQPYDALLKLTNGALTLEGLHVVVFARQFANSDPLTLFAVRGGDVAAIQCSFTLMGTRPGKTFVFGAEGKVMRSDPKDSSRGKLLARDCLIRGASLGVFQVDQSATDLVASRCVFATGSAPVLSLTNHEPPDEPAAPKPTPTSGAGGASKSPTSKGTLKPSTSLGANAPGSTSARTLKFLSCTLLSAGTAFELAPGENPNQPPVTELSVVNCVVAGDTGPRSLPVLMALPGWPQRLLPPNDESPYPNLRCVIESSLVCGWQKLILEEPGVTVVVRSGADWKQVWRNQPSLDESQFQASGWPKSPLGDLSATTSNDFVVPAEVGLKGTDGQAPGCLVGEFAEAL